MIVLSRVVMSNVISNIVIRKKKYKDLINIDYAVQALHKTQSDSEYDSVGPESLQSQPSNEQEALNW
jgi:cobalamin biosynthesis Co2+ chelatase CbiK